VMAKNNEVLLYTTNLELHKARRMIGLKLFSEGERA